MPQELLFELKDVRITSTVATFGGTSYQIARIGSVHVARRKRRNRVAVFIFFLGLALLAAALIAARATGFPENYFAMAATGVWGMIGAFLLQLVWPRRVYALVLRTISGDVDAMTTRDRQFIGNAKQAIEQAFIARARQPVSA